MQATGMSLALVLILAGNAWGQYSPGAHRQNKTTATNPALEYFGGVSARPVREVPQRRVPAPRPLQLAGITKPFANVQRLPTVSPYLNLDIPQDGTELPNYYTYVRPQIQQRRANQIQQAEIMRLQQQLRAKTASGVISNNPAGGMPTTGHSSQFMNMGGYFTGGR